MWTKTVKFTPFVGECEFLVLEKTIKRQGDEVIFRRDLYMADPDAKDGMRLIKRGQPYRTCGLSMPQPHQPEEAA